MSDEYHPETDDSPFLSDEESGKYRSITGSLNWIITLGRFDIHYATSAMSRFNMKARVGHMAAAKRILAYLKAYAKGRILFDTSYPNHSEHKVGTQD